ncbi:MAG: archaeal proteasome endopeptidase complex subunit alpha [Promethearchaeia archaeon]
MISGGQSKRYDRALTVFSPEGRLYQVEYALEAVRRGTLAVAVKSEAGVCLASQVKVPSKLMDPDSIDKIFQVDNHIGVAISGLHADSRALINYARTQAQSFRLTYDEPVRLNMLTKTVADLKQQYTQFGGVRPWGCALFFIGVDATGPQIFTTSPSGIYRSFKAYALGKGQATAREYIREHYEENQSFDEVIQLALHAITKSVEKKLDEDLLRIAYVKSEEKQYHACEKKEIAKFLTEFVPDDEGAADEEEKEESED